MPTELQPAPVEPSSEELPTNRAEWELWRLQLRVPALLRENPGLVLTLGYVGTSLIGIIFNFLYFRRFGINVLEFSEMSDFLMVVVREPLTVALALLGIPVYVLYMYPAAMLSAWLKRKRPHWQGTPEKRQKSIQKVKRLAPGMQRVFIVVYALVFVVTYSKYQANRLKASDRAQVTVEYRTDVPTSRGTPVRAVLIGTTARFVFLYFRETKEAEAVPVDAIARLTWDARFGKEKIPAQVVPAPAPDPLP